MSVDLRKHPVEGLRRHTPRRGLTVEDKAAIIICAATLWSLVIIATATILIASTI